jgi:hypothetical protein
MALKKFDKGQVVAVKYEDGNFYKAVVQTYYKDGRAKVKFDMDGEEGTYPNKDVFDFKTWDKRQKEKKAKEKAAAPTKKEEQEKLDTKESTFSDDDDFKIEGLSEEIDNDLKGVLDGKEVAEEAIFTEEAPATKESVDSIFDDSSEGSPFETEPTPDLLVGKNAKEIAALVMENSWHKKYKLGLVVTDTSDEMADKIRKVVPEEEWNPNGAAVQGKEEESIFDTSETDGADFSFGTEAPVKTKVPLGQEVDSAGKVEQPAGVADKWFVAGDDEDARFASLRAGTPRFWLERGKKVGIILITPKAGTFKEHRIRINGQTRYVTCLGAGGGRCPLCEDKKRAYVAKAFFIVDTTTYYSKKYKKNMKNQIRFCVFKSNQYEILMKYINEYFDGAPPETFRGLQLVVERTNEDTAPQSGNVFHIKGVTTNDIFKGDYDKTMEDVRKEVAPYEFALLQSKVPEIEDEPDFDNK